MLILPAAAVLLAAVASPARAAGRVQLELLGDAYAGPTAFQEWARTLGKAGIRNVRIRAGGAVARVGIEVRGTEARPLYVVTGIVRSRDELILPPGRFRRSDVGRLARWLDELARLGPEDRREPPAAFGLTAKQFEQFRDDMSRTVGFSTNGMVRREAVKRIAERLTLPVRIESGLAAMLDGDKVAEELSGLSSGTALAYVLRPAGLCLAPRRAGGRPEYVVTKSRPGLEIWPVGWEPQKPVREVLPALYEFHSINIQNVPATRAIDTIGKRLKVPVLIDHNALARHGVDPANALVTHPRGRTTYSLVLGKILFQAGLKFEVRVDEADQPFLWISTVKPV